MPRARWWVIAALSALTVTVVLLDATGVIFEDAEPSPPAPLVLPAPVATGPVAPAAVEPAPGEPDASVIETIQRILRAQGLGRSVHAVVAPLADPSRPWTELDADSAAAPASTLKLWTATAALDAFAPEDRITTSVLWDQASNTLVLVGGGDATLQTTAPRTSELASLADLAKRTASKLRRLSGDTGSAGSTDSESKVKLDYDTSLFSGPAISPGWEPMYVSSGVIAPVTALMVDQGMINPPSLARYPDPAKAAAGSFAELLRDRGVKIAAASRYQSVSASDDLPQATPIAAVESPPMNELVEAMLRNSDNQLAESLGRLTADASGLPTSFTGAAEALEQAAESRGVATSAFHVVDASGLSRDDRLTATALGKALHFASAEPALAPILSGLAVAGFDGTLADRYQSGGTAVAAGVVRAKTGTLTGISAEAGVTTTCNGVLASFVFVADAVTDTETARGAMDQAAAALASCS
jgi:D-alanyl-D-alanine carboxypeptidase/D-alanyl-D-alanine-endopeptidase (penicillin-binding protein 4)